MHNENVAVSNLRESLKECAIPKERHDSWINTLCKYLGEPGKPAALKAPTSPESAPSVRTNDKKHQQHRRSLGKELGAEGLARLRKGFDRNIFSVKPTSCSGLQLLMKHPPPYSRGLLECSGLPLFVSQGGGKLIYCCFTIQALSGVLASVVKDSQNTLFKCEFYDAYEVLTSPWRSSTRATCCPECCS